MGLWLLLVASATGAVAEPPFATLPDKFSPTAAFKLSDGHTMPVMGLGVYMSQPGAESYNAVKWAVETGYRMIDTAAVYGNEESVGEAIADSGLPRSELFITTKLWDADHGFDAALAAFDASLKKLKLEYLDLYLIHSPNTGKIVETWDALLHLQAMGKIRSIGVSNFGIPHLDALRSHGRATPAVNQFEMHPMNYQERLPLLEYCKQQGILVQAYGSLFFGKQEFMDRPELANVAGAHPGFSAAHVLLRWGLQMGFQIIPKSVKQRQFTV
ncbi:unnamed protein product [Symbiodinium sp. CCMP2456]|nr:unnamed protein product [Symbiodinium sp. CCMP2456]